MIRFLVQQMGVVGVDEEDALRENLSDRLLRFAHGDQAADLGPAAERAARDLLNQAWGTTAEGRPTLPLRDLPDDMAIHFYVTLSRAWSDRYDWAGDPADLEKAIAQCLAVRATGQSGVEAEFGYQGDLDKLLTRRYERTGRAEHLDEVVTERAARLAAAADADRSHWRMQLASSLADRFERRGDPADLQEAVKQCRAAAAETTGEDRGRALTLLFKVQSDAFSLASSRSTTYPTSS